MIRKLTILLDEQFLLAKDTDCTSPHTVQEFSTLPAIQVLTCGVPPFALHIQRAMSVRGDRVHRLHAE